MNLLAHAYLSFGNPYILTGNMISDYVKGNKKLLYPPAVQNGIALHRAIDAYTDHHPATKAAKTFFRADYRLYAGACVDVVYDHFLANDVNEFPNEETLKNFTASTYDLLEANQAVLPDRFAATLPAMRAQNWLYHYRFRFGIEKSFGGLIHRSAYLTDSATAFKLFETHYSALQQCYQDFFPGVKELAKNWPGL